MDSRKQEFDKTKKCFNENKKGSVLPGTNPYHWYDRLWYDINELKSNFAETNLFCRLFWFDSATNKLRFVWGFDASKNGSFAQARTVCALYSAALFRAIYNSPCVKKNPKEYRHLLIQSHFQLVAIAIKGYWPPNLMDESEAEWIIFCRLVLRLRQLIERLAHFFA